MTIDLQTPARDCGGTAAAFRCVTDYQPTGGPATRFFHRPTKAGNTPPEERIDPETGDVRQCVSWIPCSHRPIAWSWRYWSRTGPAR